MEYRYGTKPAIATDGLQNYASIFWHHVNQLLQILEKDEIVSSKIEVSQAHVVSRSSAKNISRWVKDHQIRPIIQEVVDNISHHDHYGVLPFAQMALRLLECLDIITVTILKKSTMIHWIAFDRGLRLDRGIRLEQGLIRSLHHDLSLRQTRIPIDIKPCHETTESGTKPDALNTDCPPPDPWTRLRVLALGGTFYQALSGLYVLDRLMKCVADHELRSDPVAKSSSSSPLYSPLKSQQTQKQYDFRPCHYFDHICGSGVSGISAIMLGTMRFSVQEAIGMMHVILESAFDVSRKSHASPNPPQKRHEDLDKALRDTLEGPNRNPESTSDEHHSGFSQSATLEADRHMCQTLCVTAVKLSKNDYSTELLRSYKEVADSHSSHESMHPTDPYDNTDPQELSIVLVSHALLASQIRSRGRDIRVPGPMPDYRDTRQLDINPAWEAYKEASKLRGNGIASLQFLCCIDSGPSKSDDRVMYLAQNRYHKELTYLMSGSFSLFEPETPSPLSHRDFESYKAAIKREAASYCDSVEPLLNAFAITLMQARRVRAQTVKWSKFAGLSREHPQYGREGSHWPSYRGFEGSSESVPCQ
jgi:hypothetical protein